MGEEEVDHSLLGIKGSSPPYTPRPRATAHPVLSRSPTVLCYLFSRGQIYLHYYVFLLHYVYVWPVFCFWCRSSLCFSECFFKIEKWSGLMVWKFSLLQLGSLLFPCHITSMLHFLPKFSLDKGTSWYCFILESFQIARIVQSSGRVPYCEHLSLQCRPGAFNTSPWIDLRESTSSWNLCSLVYIWMTMHFISFKNYTD